MSVLLLGRVLLGLALPTVVVVIWALFMAPRAKRRVPDLLKPMLAPAMFIGAPALLTMNGHGAAGSVIERSYIRRIRLLSSEAQLLVLALLA